MLLSAKLRHRSVAGCNDCKSLIVNPQSLIVNPQSLIVNPQSLIVNPQSLIVNPQSLIVNGCNCFKFQVSSFKLPSTASRDENVRNDIGFSQNEFLTRYSFPIIIGTGRDRQLQTGQLDFYGFIIQLCNYT